MVTFGKSIPEASRRALTRFLGRAKGAAGVRGQVAVLVTTSRELRALNLRFRGQDKTTDVLSFGVPSQQMGDIEGDIAISGEIAARNATRMGHSFGAELKVLILHGLLHLAGYDHEVDDGEMARQEARLRRELRLPETLTGRQHLAPGTRVPPSSSKRTSLGAGGLRNPARHSKSPGPKLFPVSRGRR